MKKNKLKIIHLSLIILSFLSCVWFSYLSLHIKKTNHVCQVIYKHAFIDEENVLFYVEAIESEKTFYKKKINTGFEFDTISIGKNIQIKTYENKDYVKSFLAISSFLFFLYLIIPRINR